MTVSRGREILTTTPASWRIDLAAPRARLKSMGVITHGKGIIPVELDGAIQSRWVSGEFEAA
jgi:hypothetical protein